MIDRQALGDLAMRAIDKVINEYGDDAELTAACLVFEVCVDDEDGNPEWHGNYESLSGSSSNHIGGLMQSTANYLLNPDEG